MGVIAVVLVLSACASQGRRLINRAGNMQDHSEEHKKLPEAFKLPERFADLLSAFSPTAGFQRHSITSRSPRVPVRHPHLSLANSVGPRLSSRGATVVRMQGGLFGDDDEGLSDDDRVQSLLADFLKGDEEKKNALLLESDGGEWGTAINVFGGWHSKKLWENYNADSDPEEKSNHQRWRDQMRKLYDAHVDGIEETPMHESHQHGWDPRLTQMKSEDTPAYGQIWHGMSHLLESKEAEEADLGRDDILKLSMLRGKKYELEDVTYLQATGEFPEPTRPDLWKPGTASIIPPNCTTWDAFDKRLAMVDSTKDLVEEFVRTRQIGEIPGIRERNNKTGKIETLPMPNYDRWQDFTEEEKALCLNISGRAAWARVEERRRRTDYYELLEYLETAQQDEIEASFYDPYDEQEFWGTRHLSPYGGLERKFEFPAVMGDEYSCSLMDFLGGEWMAIDNLAEASKGMHAGDSWDSMLFDPKKSNIVKL